VTAAPRLRIVRHRQLATPLRSIASIKAKPP